jgi:hypothetical protein
VPRLVSDRGLQPFGGEYFECGLSDKDCRAGQKCRCRDRDPQDFDFDGGIPVVIREDRLESAKLGLLAG